MSLFGAESWIKSPADRDIIRRWTVGAGAGMSHAVALPQPSDPERFAFLALGDTGDSDASGPRMSPQDAVARELAAEAALPETGGDAAFVLHMGDVVYMTGERRLYDRNFRRPYGPFLTPESTVDNLVFRLPFLPIPGNHDYYDLRGWVQWLARVPILGAGIQAAIHELFAFSMPEGGSDMGRSYMTAFVDARAKTNESPYPYRPGEVTKLPNRYYRFRVGIADFFALDSNTLDAPPPGTVAAGQVRADADADLVQLEAKSRELDVKLRRAQRELDAWRSEQRRLAAEEPERRNRLDGLAGETEAAFDGLAKSLEAVTAAAGPCGTARDSAASAQARWKEGREDLSAASDPAGIVQALESLEEAGDGGCATLRELEGCLAALPESELRSSLLAARERLERALSRWSETVTPLPAKLCDTLHALSEEALDVQRELALAKRRQRYRPEDHDAEQIAWLEAALAQSERENPDGWRIVYLHHPLYTSIFNHCERPDVLDVRASVLPILSGRAHLVLTGHSHAFEWFRSSLLPNTGIFVTGGGGQVSLRRSLMEPGLINRYRERYNSLRENGVVECAVAGRGPSAADGEEGKIYHLLRVEVTPETLTVRPIGVRRLAEGYRREQPMPVYHASELPAGRPPWKSQRMESVLIRRGEAPAALFV